MTPPLCRVLLACFASILLGPLPSTARAAAPTPLARPSVIEKPLSEMREIYLAAKVGDLAEAQAKAAAHLDTGSRAAPPDLQVAAKLAVASFYLANENDGPRASQAANLAVQLILRSRSQLSPADAATALARAGNLCEYVIGDIASAMRHYQDALTLSPRLETAANRLAYLQAVEERAQAKRSANELLRQRRPFGR